MLSILYRSSIVASASVHLIRNSYCKFHKYNRCFGVTKGYVSNSALLSHFISRLDKRDLMSKLDLNNQTTTTAVSNVSSTLRSTTINTTMKPEDPNKWRLPRGLFIPSAYDLTLRPNLEFGTFSGTIIISFKVTEILDFIQFNSKGLTIGHVHINTDHITTHEENNEIITVRLRDTTRLKPNVEYSMEIAFTGDMKNRIVGLYRSSYIGEDGKQRFIATSKFEPTYARQAFPCFDEPNYKARYTVHIEKPNDPNYIALSNMDVNETTRVDDKTDMVTFNPSVPMSTYVTCFIVCDFNHTEKIIKPKIGSDIKLRVYATPAQVEKTKYALQMAHDITNYYIDYFKIEYPLPKLDMIAIPDFVSGAMEHWGLVTYRETALLYDEKTSNAVNKQRIATVVAHELGHMWFGNLVTIDWWNDLWLNEGFATYMQFKATDNILNDWGMVDQFLVDQVHSVMDFDSTIASHPIVQIVSTPDEINEIFDTITYYKGAAILRMLEDAIGADKFSEGINKYLNKHKYGNAVTQNLFEELEATKPDFVVSEVMATWTTQIGYPAVTVTVQTDELVLQQRQFVYDDSTIPDFPISKYNYKYTIPITYTSDVTPNSDTKVWFKWNENSVTIKKPENSTWVKINNRGCGYYRVKYPNSYWTGVLAPNMKNMEPGDRASLLDDAFALAKAGLLEYDTTLTFSRTLEQEAGYVPWVVAIKRLTELKPLMADSQSGDEAYNKYKQYTQQLVRGIYKSLTWDELPNDTHLNRLLRGKVLSFSCAVGVEECLTIAKEKFDGWLNKNEELSPTAKAIVFAYGMEEISSKDWKRVLTERYMPTIDAQEKMKLLLGLASSKNSNLLNELIKEAENPAVVRAQDFFTCLTYIANNDAGTLIVWDYVKTNWLKLVERFGLNDRYLGQLIPSITASFTTNEKLEEMKIFFEKYPEAGAGAISRKKAIENVKNNIKWIEKYQYKVANWLYANIKE